MLSGSRSSSESRERASTNGLVDYCNGMSLTGEMERNVTENKRGFTMEENRGGESAAKSSSNKVGGQRTEKGGREMAELSCYSLTQSHAKGKSGKRWQSRSTQLAVGKEGKG